jgi:hypothetical protein
MRGTRPADHSRGATSVPGASFVDLARVQAPFATRCHGFNDITRQKNGNQDAGSRIQAESGIIYQQGYQAFRLLIAADS